MHFLKKIFVFLLLIFTHQYGFGQINANFIASDSIGCNSLIVQFNNLSQGTGALSYLWDFGNGVTSNLTNPQIVFNELGSFTVTLITFDQNDSDTLVKTDFIVINKSPIINTINVNINTGCVPFSPNFESVVTVGSAPLQVFVWDFGDGNSSAIEMPSHTYIKGGEFDVSLFVKDTNNCESNYTQAKLVKVVSLPIVNFTSTKHVACIDTLTVKFNNTSYGESELTFNWDFGNGNISTEVSPEEFYNGLNNYSVLLKATDIYGCSNSLIRNNYVRMQDLVADVKFIDDYLCKWEDVQIINNSQGANKHQWIFGDGTSSNSANPSKNYVDTGAFEVVYVAWLDNDCSDTIISEVFVDPVTAKFSSDQNYICQFPLTVKYNDSSINASNYQWIFGNSVQSVDNNPSIDYEVTSELNELRNIYLTDTLIVESEKYCRDTMVRDSNIHLHLPKIYFTPNDSAIYKANFTGCIPIQVDFKNESQNYFNEDPFVGLTWDFGDATTSSEQEPNHDYNNAGDYSVKLSVTNQSGCINSYTAVLLAGEPQQGKFSYTGSPIICGSEVIAFNNESTIDNLIDAWKWEFSEGSLNNDKHPEVMLMDTGFISGELTVFYNGCESLPYELIDFVYVNGPAGDFKLSLNCDDPYNYYFQNNIIDANTWYYAFGDGTYDSTLVQNVWHEYTATGNYDSFIEAENSDNGCTLLIEKKIFARKLMAKYEFLPQKNCPWDTVRFDALATVDNNLFIYDSKLCKYLWDFGDGSDLEYGFGTSDHVFKKPNNYNVTLTVRDINGCEQQLEKKVKVYKVEAGFTVSDSLGCAPMDVSFFDTSISDTTLEKWDWYFDDYLVDQNQNITKTFIDDKSHAVMLIVSDVIGCSDTIIRQNAVYSSNPTSNFQVLKTEHCLYDSVQLLNKSEGKKIKSYQWDLGNGITSNQFEPKIPYADTGSFDISLLVIDSIGCDSQLVKPNYVHIQPNPVASFLLNAISSECYPKVIGFSNTSIPEDLTFKLWNFGDGEEVANLEAPYHTYRKPGVYDVSLEVKTLIGCSDKLIKADAIDIGGPYAEIIAPDTACVNTLINISFGNDININSFQWTLDNGLNFSTDSIEIEYDSFGVKKIYLNLESDTLGTCNKLFVDSIILPTLIADFELTDYEMCTPFISLTQNKSENAVSYEWFAAGNLVSNDTNTEIKILESGLHNVKLVSISQKACRDSISKELTVFALPNVKLNNDTLICQFDTIGLQAFNGEDYWWYEENEIIDSINSSIQVSPIKSTYYKVKVVDLNTCMNIDSTYVQVQPKPHMKVLNSDTTIIIGETIELLGQQIDADEIKWDPIDYLTCAICESTTSQPMQNVTYYFIGNDQNNCFTVYDSLNIIVDAKYSVNVPTSFSPNGDGINDVLYVKGWGIKELQKFIIYDLNGRVVFQTNDINEGWDGESILGKQGEGMYLYEVSIVSFDNIERRKQGFIYIIK